MDVIYANINVKIQVVKIIYGVRVFFFLGVGAGGSPHSAKILPIPHPTLVPVFGPRLVPPQPRFVPENLKNLNTFLCQI